MSGSTDGTGFELKPFFLETPRGPAFAVYRRPAGGGALRGNVLFVPPFNEEMNRCRSMLALQAASLAAAGWGSLLLDLHGTGDSAGEYGDATWAAWLDDVAAGLVWLRGQPGGCPAVLGIRLGVALAAEVLRRDAAGVRHLIAWQPVADGKQHLTQFLRVKIAAQMDRADLPKETTATMRARFAAGEPVEVAGYELNPALARAIDAVRLGELVPPAGVEVLWLEQPPPGATELAAANAAALKAWQDGGVSARWQGFEGPSFWQQHERVVAPQVIDQSTAWLAARTGVAP